MNNKYMGLVVIVVAVLFMYVGSTMFYNTGLTITDLNVQKSDSNGLEYNVSYMLRSVRGFNKVTCEYDLLDSTGNVVGHASSELNEIKDGSFQINDNVSVEKGDNDVKKIEIKLCEIDESNTKKVMFDQSYDI